MATNPLRMALLPVSIIYWIVTGLRNVAYNIGLFGSRSYESRVICVGNITVGGTGKTPIIEHLLRQLGQGGKRMAVVSRGYKRKSKGQVIATPNSTAAEIGDEPCQLKRKFPEADIIVDADRAAAIETALTRHAAAVLMDDGMQHRSVRASATIMVCDYARPIWDDLPLPTGNLREPFMGRMRADIVVVSKCPADLTKRRAEEFVTQLSMPHGTPLFFSTIGYGELLTLDGKPSLAIRKETPVLALAGIGRPEPFFAEVKRRFANVETMSFADHHAYGERDMKSIMAKLRDMGESSIVICTEKDATRLPAIGGHTVLTLPVEPVFLFGDGDMFLKEVRRKAKI